MVLHLTWIRFCISVKKWTLLREGVKIIYPLRDGHGPLQKSYKKLLFFRSKPPFERDKPTSVPIKSPAQKMKKTHRRIQSDGSIRSLPPSIQIPDDTHSNKSIGEGKGSPVSQDYDIISDSELPSSCDGHEDYLVVDGFIDQTVESFTPLQVFVRYFYYLLINYYPKKGRIRRFRKT